MDGNANDVSRRRPQHEVWQGWHKTGEAEF